MARTAPATVKHPLRPSLCSIGIPDGRDVLAVYIWWLNQQQLRAFVASHVPSEIASSVRSIHGEDEEWRETAPSSFERIAFDTRSTAFDLCQAHPFVKMCTPGGRTAITQQTRPSWKQFLSTVDDRVLESGSVPFRLLDSAIKWAFDAHWRNFKNFIHDVVNKHFAIELVVFFVVLPPLALLLYTVGVVVVAWEEVVVAAKLVRRWASEPRRHLLSEKTIAKRRQMKARRDEVKALPKMRPRALTLHSDGGSPVFEEELHTLGRSRVKQKTVDQLGTCDLWKIPFEVREAIFRYAVGGNHVHIVKRRQRWGSVYCPAKDPTDPVHRDFCTRRDKDGYHVMSAWPKDTRPLALLVSCRQIYSECIDFLYSQNTFAFDDPDLLPDFLGSLLPSRARLVTSFHLAPVFARDWAGSNHRDYFITKQPPIASVQSLNRFLDVLEQHPTIRSLSITPKPRLDFIATCDNLDVARHILKFTNTLNLVKTTKPITLAWPEEPIPSVWYTSTHMSIPPGYWGREKYLPDEDSRKIKLREMPWQSPTVLMAFLIPFDVQCLHCASPTIIRRATRGFAEASFLPLSLSPSPPENATLSCVLMRYWTYHVFCGGWIEFQYHGEREEWSVSQGAQTISKAEADRHLAGKEGLERRYPPLDNPHERLRGITVRDMIRQTSQDQWSSRRWGTSRVIDEPMRDAYYQNVGWGTPRAQVWKRGEPMMS
ncbi:hypothetical protein DPSP01_003240 [Paraphaeosphaeria sporulosa]